jgi:hypothetical protein
MDSVNWMYNSSLYWLNTHWNDFYVFLAVSAAAVLYTLVSGIRAFAVAHILDDCIMMEIRQHRNCHLRILVLLSFVCVFTGVLKAISLWKVVAFSWSVQNHVISYLFIGQNYLIAIATWKIASHFQKLNTHKRKNDMSHLVICKGDCQRPWYKGWSKVRNCRLRNDNELG